MHVYFRSGCLIWCGFVKNRVPTRAEAVINTFVEIDPRGGIFKQSDLAKAFGATLTDKDLALLIHHTNDPSLDADGVVNKVMYKLRMMLAHVRDIHDNFFSQHPRNRNNNHPLNKYAGVHAEQAAR